MNSASPVPGHRRPWASSWAQLAHASTLLAATLASNACGSGLFDDESGQISVSVTHHSSPRNGSFPDRGERIVFATDMGWKVTLTTAFVTTTNVELRNCAGQPLQAEMRWGTVSENFLDTDFSNELLAAGLFESQKLCEVRLTQAAGEQPTIGLGGVAEKRGEKVKFYVESTEELVLDLDLSEYNEGKPLDFTADAQKATLLVVSRTYDRYFDGIDFNELEHLDLEQIVLDTLRDETRVGIDEHVEASLYEELPPIAHVEEEESSMDSEDARSGQDDPDGSSADEGDGDEDGDQGDDGSEDGEARSGDDPAEDD